MIAPSSRPAMVPFLVLLAVLLMACAGGAEETVTVNGERPTEPGDVVTSPPDTATPLPTDTAAPQATGTTATTGATLTGTVVSASDVATQPDTPLPDQLLLLLPASQARDLLGVSALTKQALRFLGATIEQAPPALIAIRTAADGGFSLAVPAGSYVLCLADTEGDAPTSPPYQTRGCAPLSLASGETLAVEISTMFGEIVVTPVP